MGENFIKNLDVLFENWVPRERFTIEKVNPSPNYYNEHSVQLTNEFKDKVKQVLA